VLGENVNKRIRMKIKTARTASNNLTRAMIATKRTTRMFEEKREYRKFYLFLFVNGKGNVSENHH
jgi:hypothetical protein